MKGKWATGKQETGGFVICTQDGYALWTAPRGRYSRFESGWQRNPKKAEIYKTWESATAAIKRYQKRGEFMFNSAQYCTLQEWKEEQQIT